ncbi:MAG: hypothetical protein IT513_07955 [Burkholderiales bacterium]|nr:hypothetical protein [Burkholderiales bacterium]
MFFRPIEPRGDMMEATQHLLAFSLLLPIVFLLVIGHLWLLSGQILSQGIWTLLIYMGMQIAMLAVQPVGWAYLAGILMVTALLHFAFYGSVMTVLARLKALSLANLLVATTLLAAAGAGLLPVLTGYGNTEPRHRLPLFEDFAESFLAYSILLALGALFEWICVRTGPRPAPAVA